MKMHDMHVMNRGAGRQKIFNNSADRAFFLETLREACHQYRIELHAYYLMGHHYHSLLKTPPANLSRLRYVTANTAVFKVILIGHFLQQAADQLF